MNRTWRSIGACLSLSASLLLGACANSGNVAKEAVDANLAFERQNNDLLLLNVVRASKDLPMHFSRINTLRLTAGTAGLSARANYPSLASLPVIGSGAQLGAPVQRGGLEVGFSGPALPALDVTPLDGQEFMQGIMAAVPAATVAVMSEVGWPSRLLFLLLVDSVSVKIGDGEDLIHHNDPRQPSYPEFLKFVGDLGLEDCSFVAQFSSESTRWSPDFAVSTASQASLEGIAAAKAAGLGPIGPAANATTFHFGTTPRQMVPLCRKQSALPGASSASGRAPASTVAKAVEAWKNVNRQTDADVQTVLRNALKVRPRAEDGARPSADPLKVTATLRSPYGVLAYLGTLLQSGRRDLFDVQAGGDPSAPVIARAELLGQSYAVPASAAGTDTAKSLSIAWQLLQLQSKGSTAPVTGTVRIAQ